MTHSENPKPKCDGYIIGIGLIIDTRGAHLRHGYLYIQTHPRRPGLVRILHSTGTAPQPDAPGPEQLRYVARFDDLDAGRMHTHELLRGRLVDVDSGLYRVDLARAVAAVESLGIRHAQVYLDAGLDERELAEIQALTERFRNRRAQVGRFWSLIGYLSAALLAARALSSLLN